jgi:hypothetical protein
MVYNWMKCKISRKALEKSFNLQSAMDLLKMGKIELDRVPTISQEDFCCRMFMLSNQTVLDEF